MLCLTALRLHRQRLMVQTQRSIMCLLQEVVQLAAITLLIISIFILVIPILTAVVFFNQNLKITIENSLLIAGNIVFVIFIYKHLRMVYRREVIIIENNKL